MRSRREDIAKLFTMMMPCLICVYSRVIPHENTTAIMDNSTLQNFNSTINSNILELMSHDHFHLNESSSEDAETTEAPTDLTTKTFQKLKLHGRNKRQVDFNMKYANGDVEVTHDVRCNPSLWKGEMTSKPLLCYQCESSSTDKEPICDNALWKFLKPSERFAIRVRCPVNRGHFCIKSVKRKTGGERKTVRGCYGLGPIKTQIDGKHIPLREGCITYYEADALTTTCFCKNDVCNTAHNPHPPLTSIVSLVLFVIFLTHETFHFV